MIAAKTRIGIIGAGTMGAGIAQVAAMHGCTVHLMDVDEGRVRKAIGGIAKQLDKLVEKGKLTAIARDETFARLSVATTAGELSDCELVIEAIVEDLAVKVAKLSEIKAVVSPNTIFASNTSSLSISAIGDGIGEPQRTVGMHFFNPAPLMPLVEVISGRRTDPSVADRVAAIATAWGKTVVRAKDTPGFIVNRVARGYYLEALRMLGEGVAAVDEIDTVMRTQGGFRMGPFELMDLVGLDVNYAVSTSVWEQSGQPARLKPHEIQGELVRAGHHGRKTGRGFYNYSANHPAVTVVRPEGAREWPCSLAEAVVKFNSGFGKGDLSIHEGYVLARIVATIMNEAALALAEGVASAEHIDIAMKTGTNYPHGPLEWAGRVGYSVVRQLLVELDQDSAAPRFLPAPLLGMQSS